MRNDPQNARTTTKTTATTQREREKDLKQSGGVGNVVPDPALSGNANLILVNWRFLPRFLYPLIPIHFSVYVFPHTTEREN